MVITLKYQLNFTNHEFVLVLNEIRNKEKSELKITERIHLEEFQNDRLYLKILRHVAPIYENSLEYVYPKTAKNGIMKKFLITRPISKNQ